MILPNAGVVTHPACSIHQADEPEQISIIWPVMAAWRCLLYFRLSFFFKSFALSEALLMAFIRAASSHAKDSCRALRRVEFKYRGNKASIICTGSCSKIRLLSKSLVSVLTCSTSLTSAPTLSRQQWGDLQKDVEKLYATLPAQGSLILQSSSSMLPRQQIIDLDQGCAQGLNSFCACPHCSIVDCHKAVPTTAVLQMQRLFDLADQSPIYGITHSCRKLSSRAVPCNQ